MSFPGFASGLISGGYAPANPDEAILPRGEFAQLDFKTTSRPISDIGGVGGNGDVNISSSGGIDNFIPHRTPLARKNNQFASQFLKKLSQCCGSESSGEGIVYSPFSIFYIMQLVYMGASGETRCELARVLCDDAEEDSSLISNMIRIGKLMTDTGVFSLANGFFLAQTFFEVVQEPYLQLMNRIGKIKGCNFSNGKAVAQEINQWISQKTNGLIKDLISPDSLDDLTALVMVNTIYFKANWKNKFDKMMTKEIGFNLIDGSILSLSMMHLTDKKFEYFEDNRIQILSMPYETSEFAMDIFLQKGWNNNPSENMAKINELKDTYMNYDLELIMRNNVKVEVYFPKFTQRKKSQLVNVFKQMGVKLIFDQNGNAEFSNMVRVPVKDARHVYVSDIIHEAVVIVDEEGTEAAAATAVTMKYLNCVDDEEKHIFRADHPFMYQIRHLNTGIILFQGIFDGRIN